MYTKCLGISLLGQIFTITLDLKSHGTGKNINIYLTLFTYVDKITQDEMHWDALSWGNVLNYSTEKIATKVV